MNRIQSLFEWKTIIIFYLVSSPFCCHSFSNFYRHSSNRKCRSDSTSYILPIRNMHKYTKLPSNFKQSYNNNNHLSSSSSCTLLHSSSIFMLEQAISSSSTTLSFIFTNDDVKQAFNVATFLPQPFWLFLILLPNSNFTKKIMGGLEIVGLFALVHLFIVITSAAQTDGTAPLVEFNDVFDPSGNPQGAMINMMKYPNFVSEEWSHVLTWDLFVGRWIWLDGLKRGIFTSHSVLLSNLIGPPGLLLHWITCLFSKKDVFPGNEALLLEEENND